MKRNESSNEITTNPTTKTGKFSSKNTTHNKKKNFLIYAVKVKGREI